MIAPLTLECDIHFQRGRRGAMALHQGLEPPPPVVEPGRVPRIAKLMALAIHFDGLIRSGEIRDYAELARLGHVTRARMSQIMALTNLAADLQEAILFLPRTQQRHDPIILQDLQPIASVLEWRKQRVMWKQLAGRLQMIPSAAGE